MKLLFLLDIFTITTFKEHTLMSLIGILIFLKKLFQNPALFLTINRPAEDIFKLKPELSIDEIVRQQSAISKLLENKKNYYVIDGSSGIENTLEQVKSILEIN